MKVINFEIDENILRINFNVNKFEFEMLLNFFTIYKNEQTTLWIIYAEDNILKVCVSNLELVFIKR